MCWTWATFFEAEIPDLFFNHSSQLWTHFLEEPFEIRCNHLQLRNSHWNPMPQDWYEGHHFDQVSDICHESDNSSDQTDMNSESIQSLDSHQILVKQLCVSSICVYVSNVSQMTAQTSQESVCVWYFLICQFVERSMQVSKKEEGIEKSRNGRRDWRMERREEVTWEEEEEEEDVHPDDERGVTTRSGGQGKTM